MPLNKETEQNKLTELEWPKPLLCKLFKLKLLLFTNHYFLKKKNNKKKITDFGQK